MKIGIITFKSGDNYGCTLQCFALLSFLKQNGHEPFLIEYQPNSFLLSLKRLGRIILGRTKPRSSKDKKSIKIRAFNRFYNDYIPSTKKIYKSYFELISSLPLADAYICGSDQIWNWRTYDSTGYPWFLKFAPKNTLKISYAASFGPATADPKFIEYIQPLLADFDFVSVRETEGQEICKIAGRKDTTLVCDPTLLLGKEDYCKLLNLNSIESPKTDSYGFCYMIGWKTDFPKDELVHFLEKKDLKLRFVASQGMEEIFPSEYPTIPEWLNAYLNAELIITNSFHGTVFAILMQKPFITYGLAGHSAKMNSRVITLLRTLGLESRLTDGKTPSVDDVFSKKIDWSVVNEKIEILRGQSIQFLKNCGL
jgi:hypothetical protein